MEDLCFYVLLQFSAHNWVNSVPAKFVNLSLLQKRPFRQKRKRRRKKKRLRHSWDLKLRYSSRDKCKGNKNESCKVLRFPVFMTSHLFYLKIPFEADPWIYVPLLLLFPAFPARYCLFSLEIYGKQVLFLHARVSYLFCPSFSDPSYCCFPRNVLEKQTLQFTPLARIVVP